MSNENYEKIEYYLKQLHLQASPRKLELLELKNGEYLLEQGQDLDNAYLLCEGKIGIYNLSIDGATSRVVFITPGELIGEMELLVSKNKVAFSARAYADCQLIKIKKNIFSEWLSSDTSFSMYINHTLAQKLYDTASAICMHVRNDAIGIVSMYIMDSTQEELMHNEVSILKDTRPVIAENCRVSERTVNRSIKYLHDLGYISLAKGKISVNREQFANLSNLYTSHKLDFI